METQTAVDEKERLSESEAEAFRKIARYIAPNALAEIASEIVQGACPFADEIVEICFDVERINNGAAEFISAIIAANR